MALSLHELVQQYKKDSTSGNLSQTPKAMEQRGKRIASNHIRILELITDLLGPGGGNNNRTDYIYDLLGDVDGINKVFTISGEFSPNTTAVWLGGLRMTKGADYDYVELGTNQIEFTVAPEFDENIIVSYHDPNIT